MIPFWSDTNPKVKDILLPTKETNWSDLTAEDKGKMWKYLERHFFNSIPNNDNPIFNSLNCSYRFYGEDIWENEDLVKKIVHTIHFFNEKYKRKSYAQNFLENPTFDSACYDFHRIFINRSRDVVFEMLSLFGRVMVFDDGEKLWKKDDESDTTFKKRKEELSWKKFDEFSERLNEVLGDFGINYKLTRAGFVVTDEPAVVDRIYEPALKKLSFEKWLVVNRDLKDAFSALNDDKDGSGAITHALSALQGFLQILVYDKTGKGDTSDLIQESLNKGLVPDDEFSKKVIKDVNTFWAKERRDKGDPHPKKSYATKNQAKLVITLVMVFIDHVL